MGKQYNSRRRLLAAIAGLFGGYGLKGAVAKEAVAELTARAAEGPFYPKPAMRMPDIDNDLVKITGLVEQAGGEIFTLRGTLFNRDGQVLAGHRIEIWQCDMNGKYLHSGDRRSVAYDQAFQGFGQDTTDESGAYVFRTIKPAIYPGRSPHIHVKVFDGDRELLTTQFYIKDDANNSRDGLFNRLSADEADAVSMVFVDGASGPEATIDVVV